MRQRATANSLGTDYDRHFCHVSNNRVICLKIKIRTRSGTVVIIQNWRRLNISQTISFFYKVFVRLVAFTYKITRAIFFTVGTRINEIQI